MAEMEIAITRKAGSTRMRLPDDIPIRNLIPTIVQELDLPTEQGGKNIIYALATTTGTLISSESTLAGAGVKQNDMVKLMHKVVKTAETHTHSTEKSAIYCTQCGTQFFDEAKFCWKCGKPKKDNLQHEDLQGKAIKWEVCGIYYEAVKKSGFLTGGQARWYAEAVGPKGNYRVGESPLFTAYVDSLKTELPDRDDKTYQEAIAALDVLTSKLINDGWEFMGGHGDSYWNKQFRRRVM